ncbi:hypothetical protein J2W98_003822 [Paenibacillus peoriae]|uniref:Uncharacterized protein n=1 Tax=Paenibacillus peoriae TaxID=59893 RepID=A0ABU1QIR9_9BACL|nr:hypothetical protein [Paenibacillus peoriae]MDR6779542.1 hypothetical protein [Paenibacillus peoriae]
MKLFKVDNNFTGCSLQSYLVIAATKNDAVEMAGLKLRDYALNNCFTINKKMYQNVGITIKNIFEHIDKPSYSSHFKAKCLSEDTSLEQAIKFRWEI